jgi:hypothetical protein
LPFEYTAQAFEPAHRATTGRKKRFVRSGCGSLSLDTLKKYTDVDRRRRNAPACDGFPVSRDGAWALSRQYRCVRFFMPMQRHRPGRLPAAKAPVVGRCSAVAWCDRVTIVFMADLYCWQQEVRVKAPCSVRFK